MSRLLFILFLSGSFLLHAQNDKVSIVKMDGPNPWSSLEVNNNPDQFQFIVVTDRTGGHRPGVFEEAVQKINLLQPEFVMSVGDLIEGYTEDTTILNSEWDEFTGFIDQLEMPFFYVPGNHDLTNPVQGVEYEKRFGRTYYHFTYKDVLFLCLNSEDQFRGAGRGTISEPQFNYIRETLIANQEVRHTFIFLHQPLWIQDDPKYWPQVEDLLKDRPHTVFAGHYHHYVKRERNNGRYIMLATTGGGSRLRGRDFGEFDHVAWVTMTAAGPVVANLWLKGIWDENVSTEETETFINDLFSSNLVEIEPCFADQFSEEHDFKIKLSNNLDIPVDIKIEEGFGWDVWITADADSLRLNPNSVEWVDAKFIPRKNNAPVSQLRATPVKFVVSAELSEEAFLEIPVPVNLKPLTKKYIPFTDHEFKVDGVPDDGIALADGFETTTDNTMRFAVYQNKTHLYITAQVEDDMVVVDTSTSITRQDNIGLSLSFLPPVKSALAPVDNYYLRMTVEKGGNMSLVSGAKSLPDDWKYTCKETDSGFNFELALPLHYLDDLQGGHWQSLRLNWTLDDLDVPSDQWQEIERNIYLPSWGSDEEILGSGMYFRE